MIGEKLLTMKQAAEFIEREFGIKRRASTIWGWAYYGLANVGKLECTRVGNVWHTSEGAIRRFFSTCYRQSPGEQNELRIG